MKRIPTPTTTITMTRYLHKDHLGSVVAITNESGAIVESLAYDAWGKRRPAGTWQTPSPGVFIAAITLTRGFTLHEHLDQVGLIDMGGRVYDPELGRFLSPDPFVQFPASTQGFNRYAYVSNNPLSYTDPSGYFLKKALRIGVTIAAAYYTGGAAAKLWGEAVGAAIGGAVGGYLNTGSMQGAAFGAVSGGVAYGVGGAFDHNIGYDQLGRMATKAVTHGVTQGLIARAGGGRFGDGALGGMASTFGAPAVARAGSGIRQAMAAAALGGTASVIGGGKFANGAIAAAWVNLFNDQCLGRCHGTESPDRIPMPDHEQRDMAKAALLVVAVSATGPAAGYFLAAPRVIDIAAKVELLAKHAVNVTRARTTDTAYKVAVATGPVTMNPNIHQRVIDFGVGAFAPPPPPFNLAGGMGYFTAEGYNFLSRGQ